MTDSVPSGQKQKVNQVKVVVIVTRPSFIANRLDRSPLRLPWGLAHLQLHRSYAESFFLLELLETSQRISISFLCVIYILSLLAAAIVRS